MTPRSTHPGNRSGKFTQPVARFAPQYYWWSPPPAPQALGAPGGAPSGPGPSAQTPITIAWALLTTVFLKEILPRKRLRSLCLFLGWTMVDKAAVAKVNRLTGPAGKIGNKPEQDAEHLSWSQRICMDYASDAEIREEYDGKSLENLAIIAQWEPAVGDRALAQTKAFMHAVDQKISSEAKTIHFSTTGIASSALDEPKAIAQN